MVFNFRVNPDFMLWRRPLSNKDAPEKAKGEAIETLETTAKTLAMHVVAARPAFLDQASAPEGALEREKNLLLDQARESGKDPKILERMVEGRYVCFSCSSEHWIDHFHCLVMFVLPFYVVDGFAAIDVAL